MLFPFKKAVMEQPLPRWQVMIFDCSNGFFISTAARTGRPLTVAYIDIDNFKLLNDFVGHRPVALLETRGYTVKRVNAQGETAAIRWIDGWLEGAPDPRTEGTAEGH